MNRKVAIFSKEGWLGKMTKTSSGDKMKFKQTVLLLKTSRLFEDMKENSGGKFILLQRFRNSKAIKTTQVSRDLADILSNEVYNLISVLLTT